MKLPSQGLWPLLPSSTLSSFLLTFQAAFSQNPWLQMRCMVSDENSPNSRCSFPSLMPAARGWESNATGQDILTGCSKPGTPARGRTLSSDPPGLPVTMSVCKDSSSAKESGKPPLRWSSVMAPGREGLGQMLEQGWSNGSSAGPVSLRLRANRADFTIPSYSRMASWNSLV